MQETDIKPSEEDDDMVSQVVRHGFEIRDCPTDNLICSSNQQGLPSLFSEEEQVSFKFLCLLLYLLMHR